MPGEKVDLVTRIIQDMELEKQNAKANNAGSGAKRPQKTKEKSRSERKDSTSKIKKTGHVKNVSKVAEPAAPVINADTEKDGADSGLPKPTDGQEKELSDGSEALNQDVDTSFSTNVAILKTLHQLQAQQVQMAEQHKLAMESWNTRMAAIEQEPFSYANEAASTSHHANETASASHGKRKPTDNVNKQLSKRQKAHVVSDDGENHDHDEDEYYSGECEADYESGEEADGESEHESVDHDDEFNKLLSNSKHGASGSKTSDSHEVNESVEAEIDNDPILCQVKDMYQKEEEVSAPLSKALAGTFNNLLASQLKFDKVKPKLEQYSKPKNCTGMVVPRTNPEAWGILHSTTQKRDYKMSLIQSDMLRAMTPMMMVSDIALQVRNGSLKQKDVDFEDIFQKTIDSVSMLTFANQEMSRRRRDNIRPHLDPKFQKLCDSTNPITEWLLGNDLSQAMDNSHKQSQMNQRLGRQNKPFRGQQQGQGQQPKNDFLGKQNFQKPQRGGRGRGGRGRGRGRGSRGQSQGRGQSRQNSNWDRNNSSNQHAQGQGQGWSYYQ